MAEDLREDLTEAIRIRTGAEDRELPGRALVALVSLLARALPQSDAEWLCRDHPAMPAGRPVTSAAELHDAVGEWLGVSKGRAVEIAETVLAVLAESLPDELLTRMKKHLPPDLAAELDPTREVPRVEHHAMRGDYRDTLSEGRPGSKHPISEAKRFSARR
ncbi:MAG: DUF2267 domain-containing protein [Polyangiales bacterium]